MSYTIFSNGTSPAINDEALNNMQIELMKLVFPVGSTYCTQDNTNPSEILKFGTWERVKGKVLVGLDEDDTDFNEIGKTGGEKKHTLTVDEMPSHTHDVAIAVNNAVAGDSKYYFNFARYNKYSNYRHWYLVKFSNSQSHWWRSRTQQLTTLSSCRVYVEKDSLINIIKQKQFY